MNKISFSSLKEIQSLEPGKYRVETGLYLIVKKTQRYWAFIYSFNGKRRELSLGTVKIIPVAKARQLAAKARVKVISGIDPLQEKQNAKLEAKQQKEDPKIYFKNFWEEAFLNISNVRLWKNQNHGKNWEYSIKEYVLPFIAEKEVGAIGRDDILKILNPIWLSHPVTASILRGRLEKIFAYGIVKGAYKQSNPAVWKGNLEMFLPPISKVRKVEHFKAVSPEVLRNVIKGIYPPDSVQKSCVLFTILTASRINESAGAKWDEIDFENKVWTVPPERRKDGKDIPHRVPLSDVAIKVLQNRPRFGELIFSRDGYAMVCKANFAASVRRLLKIDSTMHGMRSTFRDWCEQNDVPFVLAEKSLMHATGNEVVQAYQRDDLLEKRREVMQRWADYLFKS